MKKKYISTSGQQSRREFILKNAIGGLGLTMGNMLDVPLEVFSPALQKINESTVQISPRYYRWYVDRGQEWLEVNTDYAHLNWKIPVSQAALVLVDVWQRHYIKEPEERAEKIIDEALVPLIQACRANGLKVIHAPSPPVAHKHANWVNLPIETCEADVRSRNWPPAEFRSLSGPYQQYRRPFEPRDKDLKSLPPHHIHPKAEPVPDEPVIATGKELHAYCQQEGILFLLFAGFNTNACIITRDYGALEMSKRGYQVVLVRDCTTGMEAKHTQASLSQTSGAILFLEMFGQYSVTSEEIIGGFSPA